MEEQAAMFVDDQEFMSEVVPEAKTKKIISPRSAILGVQDEILENTVFTRVKMENGDFMRIPKKLPRLVFINKDRLEDDLNLVSGIAPLVLALTPKRRGDFFTASTSETDNKLHAIMRDSYLLLPLFPTDWRGLMPWGVDVVFRPRHFSPSAGKLRVKAFGCDHLFLFGKRYTISNADYDLRYFWEHRSHWNIQDTIKRNLCDFDIKANAEAIC